MTHVSHVCYIAHMKRQFEHRVRLAVYLEAKDLQALTARARKSGKLVVEYVRELLLSDLEQEAGNGMARGALSLGKKDAVSQRSAASAGAKVRKVDGRKPQVKKAVASVGISDSAESPESPAFRDICSHDYEPKKCPFPMCLNYKWKE